MLHAVHRTGTTILTADAEPELAHLHTRMPVSLEPQYFADWLDAKKVDSESLAGFIAEQPKGLFAYYPVSQRVNKSFEKVAGKNQRIEGADLIQPVGQTESAPQDHRLF